MGTEDFTNKAWPVENATSCNIPKHPAVEPIDQAAAEELCVGIGKKEDRANCAFDVALTGEPNFAKTYTEGQELVKRAKETEGEPGGEASRTLRSDAATRTPDKSTARPRAYPVHDRTTARPGGLAAPR